MAHLRSYWSTTRLNGKPVEQGTFYLISEFDDMNPIATMGASVDEVLAKSEYARAATEAEVRKLRTEGNTRVATPSAAQPRKRMTDNEVFQATSDLTYPGKAGDAMVRLVEDVTGVNLRHQAITEFGARAEEWQAEHPEFYAHDGNIDLLTTYARRAVNGDWASVSKDLLTTTFMMLKQRGLLFEAPAPAVPVDETFPGGSPVQRVEYPRGGRLGTGTRSTNFRANQSMQPRTPKYTDDDIRKMTAAKKKELILSNDPDFAAACDRLYATANASA